MVGETAVRRSRSCTLCIVAVALFSVVSAAGMLAAPVLLWKHPLLLIALTPRTTFLLVAAPHVAFAPFFAVAVARAAAADPFHFVLGRRGAHVLAAKAPRAGKVLQRAERLVQSWGMVAVGLRPVGPVIAAAGAGGLPTKPVAIADLVGTAAQMLVIYQGARAGPSAPLLAGAVAITLCCGAGARAAVTRRRCSRALPALAVPPASP